MTKQVLLSMVQLEIRTEHLFGAQHQNHDIHISTAEREKESVFVFHRPADYYSFSQL